MAPDRLVIHEDAQGFRELMRAAGEFDKQLALQLRRDIRTAANTVVGKMRTAVLGGGPYATQVGLRQGLADGLRVQLETTTSHPGVRILSTGASLPANKRVMVKAWEKQTFEHPVFGDAAVAVTQEGHRYFSKVVYDNRGIVTTAVTKAMQSAASALGREIG